jgi:hypothetical protein
MLPRIPEGSATGEGAGYWKRFARFARVAAGALNGAALAWRLG